MTTLTVEEGNTNSRGRLSTVDLLVEIVCLVAKVNLFPIQKATNLNG